MMLVERSGGDVREMAARIADRFTSTRVVPEKSDNVEMAKVIAMVMSDTAQRIAESIRSMDIMMAVESH